MKVYDVVVVGSGISGLFTSINLHKNIKVMVISKSKFRECNSYLAQGGVSVLRDDSDFEDYVEDTLRAGKYENDRAAVEYMIRHSREVIKDLVDLGVEFDREGNKFKYTKEGAHSRERIVHHEDLTGKEIIEKLLKVANSRDNITLQEDTEMIDIIRVGSDCVGIVVKYKDAHKKIFAKKVVLATGGIGGIFKNTTNFNHIKGDGIAVAIKNNIETKDLSYVQIHPTAFYSENEERKFLISEAVRGEGAYLLNHKGERFVDELLPRDIVSNRILEEMKKENTNHLYLSLAHRGEEFAKKRFPNIYNKCLEHGYNLGKESIPVAPAQHYFMGGIKINKEGKTSLNNLYAVGESSCVGIHGANRLASNSLLEGLVFSKEAAKSINKEINKKGIYISYTEKSEEEFPCNEREKTIKEVIKKENREFYDRWIR